MNKCKAEVGEVYRRLRLSYVSEDGGAGLCHAIHAMHACTCKRHSVKPPDSKLACWWAVIEDADLHRNSLYIKKAAAYKPL
jgi:hypothetical protein